MRRETIRHVESILGYSSRQATKSYVAVDLVRLVDGLRTRLDAVETWEPDPLIIATLKSIIDEASVLRQYAKYLALGLPTINHAAELQLRAERKAGQWLSLHLAD